MEMEGCAAYDFFNLKWSSSLHLELLGSPHMEINHFQPNLISYVPQGELGDDLLLHLLLSYLVGGQSIITIGREVGHLCF